VQEIQWLSSQDVERLSLTGNCPRPPPLLATHPAARNGARTSTKSTKGRRPWPCRRWRRDEMSSNTRTWIYKYDKCVGTELIEGLIYVHRNPHPMTRSYRVPISSEKGFRWKTVRSRRWRGGAAARRRRVTARRRDERCEERLRAASARRRLLSRPARVAERPPVDGTSGGASAKRPCGAVSSVLDHASQSCD